MDFLRGCRISIDPACRLFDSVDEESALNGGH